MTANVALLKLTLKHIEMAPCTWDQRDYRRKAECGTVMCFAGWACTLAGGRWNGPSDGLGRNCLIAEDGDDSKHVFGPPDRRVTYVGTRGRRVLALTTGQALRLFHVDNTLPDLHRIVDEICAGVTS